MSGPASHPSALVGIGLKIASVAIFVAMSAAIKGAGEVPVGQIVFFRSFFAILPILVLLGWRGELRYAVATAHPLSHFVRGIVGVCGMGFSFFALTRLPLPEAIALNYAQPLLVVVASVIFLGERARVYRWSAVLIGLIGVLVVSWPKLTLFDDAAGFGSREAWGVAAALASAAFSACATLLVRGLVRTERTPTIVLWFSLTAAAAGLATMPFGWSVLSTAQAILLVSAGLCGGVAQILMTEAYRHAEASTVAPFEYASLLIGVVVGYLAFGDVPTVHMITGSLIIVGAGIFIIWREHRLGLSRGAARKVTPPQ